MKLKSKTSKPVTTTPALVCDEDFRSKEAYKAIRTNILHLLKESDKKTILITSPYAGAGKTTTVANLAITFAQLGKKVLIIDCDMRKPSIHKIFSLHSTPGLSSILAGDTDTDIIRETSYDNLHVLTAGAIPTNPSELLHSSKFTNLLNKLSEKYNILFIDAPPVDIVTDAVIISPQAAGTVLVIRQNSTEKEELLRTVQTLRKVNANILGYVLNAVDYEKFSYSYGHYTTNYRKRYSYYYQTPEDEKEKE